MTQSAGAGHPPGADDTIRLADAPDQIEKRPRRRRAVGIDVADDVRHGRELEAFDERAAFADGILELEPGDAGELGGDALDDAQGVVAAAVEHDDDLERAAVLLLEERGVIAQHRFDPVLLVVRRDEQQEAGFGHAGSH